jgi:signal transduction protein with GAF and PtsI domain
VETKVETYYHSLYEAAVVLNSARAAKDILQSIVENVTTALNAKGCSLMLLTPDRKVLARAAAHGLSESYMKKGPVSADRSLSEALSGKAVSVLHAAEDDRVQYPEHARTEDIASILSVPMMLREEIVG